MTQTAVGAGIGREEDGELTQARLLRRLGAARARRRARLSACLVWLWVWGCEVRFCSSRGLPSHYELVRCSSRLACGRDREICEAGEAGVGFSRGGLHLSGLLDSLIFRTLKAQATLMAARALLYLNQAFGDVSCPALCFALPRLRRSSDPDPTPCSRDTWILWEVLGAELPCNPFVASSQGAGPIPSKAWV